MWIKQINLPIKLLFVFMIAFSLSVYTNPTTIAFQIEQNPTSTSKPKLTSIDKIDIDADEDFGVSGYDFPGSGTKNNPYRIENYEITEENGRAISIEWTTKYFIIQNCEIKDSHYGIYLVFIASDTAIVANNTFKNNAISLYLFHAQDTSIADNNFEDNKGGIEISDSSYCTIAKNSFTSSGILIGSEMSSEEYLSLDVYENYINGTPIEWVENRSSYTFSHSKKYAQLFLINCSDILIENILLYDFQRSLQILYCSNICMKDNCGTIRILGSDNIEIKDTKDSKTIEIEKSKEIKVLNNTGNSYKFGIEVYDSENIAIINNTIKGTDNGEISNVGIWLERSIYCTIEGNKLIYISNEAISLRNATQITINKNILSAVLGYHAINIDTLSSDNLICTNIFFESYTNPNSQAYDDGMNNIWCNVSENKGNQWTDWSGSGAYEIDGSAGSTDPYPIIFEDGDEMPLEWEIKNLLDPFRDDGNEDGDNDGLVNINEYKNGANPWKADTDGDGWLDGEEVNIHGTNPADEDSDDDGLTDPEEYNDYGTNPLINDTDNDGLLDGEEIFTYGTDPLDEDSDDDGWSDGDEIDSEADPLDPESYPENTIGLHFTSLFIIVTIVGIVSVISKKKSDFRT